MTILTYPVYSKSSSGNWRKTDADTYAFKVADTDVVFTYGGINSGIFDCTHTAGSYCTKITE